MTDRPDPADIDRAREKVKEATAILADRAEDGGLPNVSADDFRADVLGEFEALAAEVVALRADKNGLIGAREFLREELAREREAREAAERERDEARHTSAAQTRLWHRENERAEAAEEREKRLETGLLAVKYHPDTPEHIRRYVTRALGSAAAAVPPEDTAAPVSRVAQNEGGEA